jgi:hypothetical protein
MYQFLYEFQGRHTIDDIMIKGDSEVQDIPFLQGPSIKDSLLLIVPIPMLKGCMLVGRIHPNICPKTPTM